MNFLLNNPVIAFILFALLGLTVLAVSKIVNEVKLNRDLRIKQQAMRIVVNTPKGFAKRLSLLGAQALAPAAVVAIAVVAGLSVNAPDPLPFDEFQTVQSEDDIVRLFEDFQSRYSSVGYRNWFGGDLEMVTDGAPESDDSADKGSDDYSDTNNQVIGVDEMDNVLTDGKYIYTIYGNELQITLAYTQSQGPDALELIKTIEYSNDYCDEGAFYPMGMFVDEDKLIVIGNLYKHYCEQDNGENKDEYVEYYWYGYDNEIQIKVYDKVDFELQDEYEFNGHFTGTRKIGNDLYLVTNNYIPFYLEEDLNMENHLPKYSVNGVETTALYEDISYVEGANPNSFTTFYGIDLETKEVDMEVVLADSGFNLYVSNDNMYLVGSVFFFWPLDTLVDVESQNPEYKTAILRVGIDEGNVNFNGVGYVEGYSLNQFSMDEYEGKLRITTTTGWWGEDINNRLWVLDENMDVLSVVENLGKPGETIRSTRFVGEYAYIVTFLQTDPFYVINLTDPENPVKEGELEIPGFSTYLQPMGENYMLGIGFAADDEGRVNGLKVSIYDITDKSDPQVFDEVTFDYDSFGYAWSSATYNHKDLLVSLSKGLIALPFSTWGRDDNSDNWYYKSGVVVLKFDLESGFEKMTVNNEEVADYEFVVHEENQDYNIYVYKAKFIDNYFYTISNKFIKVSTIEDTETEINSVLLREVESHYYDTEEVID